ncbi:chemotaxis protein [Streptococcus ictaluri]|uniref:Uncharacterized protein n=1 Tax=Streptococcus ictaluri 707-05 TaxID=764299 RepID=G5K054_9STRE|nr:hypothetical protein [Streptococcus ictaluri]EHI70935.1 hypothetical protein STRIC_0919 [Streptococcus ictaluri 707-05]
MKIKSLLAIGLTSLAAYNVYQKRHAIKETLETFKESKEAIQFDVDKIKVDLALIQDQSKQVQAISKDLTYKWRVFNQETQPQLKQIQDRLSKYQEMSEDANEN